MYGRATVGKFSERPQLLTYFPIIFSLMTTSHVAGVSGLPGRALLASNVPAGTNCSMSGRYLNASDPALPGVSLQQPIRQAEVAFEVAKLVH